MKTLILSTYTLLHTVLCFAHAPVLRDNPGDLTYKIQSVYIYNFIKEIQWPPEYGDGNFIIGIFGESDIEVELRRLAASRTANNRKIVVKKYAKASEIDKDCHVLYLATAYYSELSSVLQKTRGTSTLVVTHKEGAARFGSLVNFVTEKGKPRFEMNLTAFDKSHLKYTQQLKSVAISVD